MRLKFPRQAAVIFCAAAENEFHFQDAAMLS
jgi:hypothetical protein